MSKTYDGAVMRAETNDSVSYAIRTWIKYVKPLSGVE